MPAVPLLRRGSSAAAANVITVAVNSSSGIRTTSYQCAAGMPKVAAPVPWVFVVTAQQTDSGHTSASFQRHMTASVNGGGTSALGQRAASTKQHNSAPACSHHHGVHHPRQIRVDPIKHWIILLLPCFPSMQPQDAAGASLSNLGTGQGTSRVVQQGLQQQGKTANISMCG